MNGIFLEEERKAYADLMGYLKTLSDDALLWLLLCIGVESKRRTMQSEGKETRYNATGGAQHV